MKKVTVKQAIKINRMLDKMWHLKWNAEKEIFPKRLIMNKEK